MRIALAALALFFVMEHGSVHSAELPLKRVVLSTSGLAQFTHQGRVEPKSTIDLSVRLDQVDDILKSLTVFDTARAAGAISLAGKTPLAELFRDLPFNADALSAMPALLNALIGTEVEIEGEVSAKGRVLKVEEERVQLANNAGFTVRHRLTVLTERGFVQAILQNVSALRFTDPETRKQIDRALSGIAQNRAKDRRTISIAMLGESAREAGFTYVVAAPVWKSAYRIVLPKDGGRARLQGWGVVENLTGSDWNGVELTLISGNPVALRQALYSPFFVERPEVPVSAATRVVPKTDDQDQFRARKAAPAQGRALAAAPSGAGGAGSRAESQFNFAQAAPATPPMPMPEEVAGSSLTATSEEAATQVLYRFPERVTLAVGSTLMVPFSDRDISATRTWLYQPDTNDRRPLAAVRIKNDTDAALPAGIITAFDTGPDGTANFAGDAQLPLMPKGSSKFVTFALDSKTDIRRSSRPIKETRLGKAVRGELTLTVKSVWSIDYEITPPVDEDRDLVIDEARSDGWTVVGEAKDIEETPTRVRLKVTVTKGKPAQVTLRRERTEVQTVSLTGLDPEQLLTSITGLENESPALKAAVAKLSALNAKIADIAVRRERLDAERKSIGTDQDRIRKNLTSVGQGSDLGRRYMDTLRDQENRLTAIGGEEKSLDAELAAARKAAEEVASALTL
jgi:hypothetical protein